MKSSKLEKMHYLVFYKLLEDMLKPYKDITIKLFSEMNELSDDDFSDLHDDTKDLSQILMLMSDIADAVEESGELNDC